MKNKEKIFIGLFSCLIILSLVNTTSAASPSFIGVAIGDSYTWVPTVNMANVNATGIALVGQENWTIAYNMLSELYKNTTGMELGYFAGTGLKLDVNNVSDVITVAPGIFASTINIDLYYSVGLNNWTMLLNNTMFGIYDPNSLNETTIMSGFSEIPLIMAKGFNYTMMTNAFSDLIASTPALNGNITVQTQGRGFKITYLSTYLEYAFNMSGAPFDIGTLGDLVFNVRWNSNGIFEYGSVEYGGLTIASIQLVPINALIPGYEIFTVLGISMITILSIVYIKRKKNI